MMGSEDAEQYVEEGTDIVSTVHGKLVDLYDTIADFTYAYIGKRSYNMDHSADGVLATIQTYHPPSHLQPQEEYLREIQDVMAQRVKDLETYSTDGMSMRDAMFRFQLDETAYFMENAGALFGGANLWILALHDGFQPVDTLQMLIGLPMLVTSPSGLNNWDKIRRFQHDIENQQQYYEEALHNIRTDGSEALGENISHKFHLPIIGTRHIDYRLENGIYYDATVISDGPDRDAVGNHAAAEGYNDFFE